MVPWYQAEDVDPPGQVRQGRDDEVEEGFDVAGVRYREEQWQAPREPVSMNAGGQCDRDSLLCQGRRSRSDGFQRGTELLAPSHLNIADDVGLGHRHRIGDPGIPTESDRIA